MIRGKSLDRIRFFSVLSRKIIGRSSQRAVFPLKLCRDRLRLGASTSMSSVASSAYFDRSAGTIRRLKAIIVALLVSNVALGLFSAYLLRQTDRSYSELIDRDVPLLNDLQTLTALSAAAVSV